MRINLRLQNYKKMLQVTSFLEKIEVYKPTNFKYDVERLKQLEKDVFLNSKENSWQIVGQVKLTKRDTNETVWAQIKRMKKREKVRFALMVDNKDLISREISPGAPTNAKLGLQLDILFKHPSNQDYEGLAKIMDILAVKESQFAGFEGKMHLKTATQGFYQKSEPIHWLRGFKRIDYFDKYSEEEKREYDSFMGVCAEKYKQAKKNGKTTEEAKAEMIETQIPRQIMVLPDSIIESHKKQAEAIRYY